MKTLTTFTYIINLVYLLLFLSFPLWGGAILGFLGGTGVLILLLLPLLLGPVFSLSFLSQNRWSLKGKSPVRKILVLAPLINLFLIVGAFAFFAL